MEEIVKRIPEIEAKLHYTFKDPSFLILAFIHRSYANEHREITDHNERLEFLGDSVLGLVAAEYVYLNMPSIPEGDLSLFRSRLVDATSCFNYIEKLKVDEYIMLGKGEKRGDGRGRDTILSDLFEAIIGAIFLDSGLEAAKKFILDNFSEEIQEILKKPEYNWKALLQEYCQKTYQKQPTYAVISETGPEHSKMFKVIVSLDDAKLGEGEGSSKKIAQQAAAADALTRFSITS